MEFTDFIIKIRSLKNGTQVFEYNLDGSFFAEFGNSIILDASLRVLAEVEKSSGRMEVNFLVNGIVVTECDRCLEKLEISVQPSRLNLPEREKLESRLWMTLQKIW